MCEADQTTSEGDAGGPLDNEARLCVRVAGLVQGVGFRPFVYRLARELALRGWVVNSTRGVTVEVEGPRPRLESFLLRVGAEKPPRAAIHGIEPLWLEPVGLGDFEVRQSSPDGERTAALLPDIATCADCLAEVFDPANRRYRYPFTNCTNCGPRYSIIRALPYDRPNTSMAGFEMCPRCRAEYEDPADRRFHAQPNACPECGPRVQLLDTAGSRLADRDEALRRTVEALRRGAVVALKGLGGLQLLVDPDNEEAVARLRTRKQREEKPFALMYPDLDAVRRDCFVEPLEARLLASPEAPITLLRRRAATPHPAVASPSSRVVNPNLGVMLPCTPLHHVILRDFGRPLIATSGNLSDETLCISEEEALGRLGGIADVFLTHDRPIERPVDDSIARIVAGRELVLRRARGYAPWPIVLARAAPPVLAVGGHLKNTVALSVGAQVLVSQHLGDLEGGKTEDAFVRTIDDLLAVYPEPPTAIAHDTHPDYLSTRHARNLADRFGVPAIPVQHHHAHALSCLAENQTEPPALAVSWDGTGHGEDATVWGGEFLAIGRDGAFRRVAHLRTFPLPGGEAAAREPRRSALGILHEIFGGDGLEALSELTPLASWRSTERRALTTALARGVNAPRTSSAGRLFDAVAALAGLRQVTHYEGQAAMELEFAADAAEREESATARRDAGVSAIGFALREPRGEPHGGVPMVLDWEPLVRSILDDLRKDVSPGIISLRFHEALVEAVVSVARHAGERRVALTGGCFQNRRLTEACVERLWEEGFTPLWHQRVPPGDGGIALGQIMAAVAHLERRADS